MDHRAWKRGHRRGDAALASPDGRVGPACRILRSSLHNCASDGLAQADDACAAPHLHGEVDLGKAAEAEAHDGEKGEGDGDRAVRLATCDDRGSLNGCVTKWLDAGPDDQTLGQAEEASQARSHNHSYACLREGDRGNAVDRAMVQDCRDQKQGFHEAWEASRGSLDASEGRSDSARLVDWQEGQVAVQTHVLCDSHGDEALAVWQTVRHGREAVRRDAEGREAVWHRADGRDEAEHEEGRSEEDAAAVAHRGHEGDRAAAPAAVPCRVGLDYEAKETVVVQRDTSDAAPVHHYRLLA